MLARACHVKQQHLYFTSAITSVRGKGVPDLFGISGVLKLGI